jgi:hypothetical protein
VLASCDFSDDDYFVAIISICYKICIWNKISCDLCVLTVFW